MWTASACCTPAILGSRCRRPRRTSASTTCSCRRCLPIASSRATWCAIRRPRRPRITTRLWWTSPLMAVFRYRVPSNRSRLLWRSTLRGNHLDSLNRDALCCCGGRLSTGYSRIARQQLPRDLDSMALVVCKFGGETLKRITGPLSRLTLTAAVHDGCGVEQDVGVHRFRAVGLDASGIGRRHVACRRVVGKRTCSRGLRNTTRHFHHSVAALQVLRV